MRDPCPALGNRHARPEPPPPAGAPAPTTDAEWQAELAAWEAAHAPSSLAERQDSRTAFEDLSRDQALDLAEQSFPDYLGGLEDPLLAEPGDQIQSYLNDNVAVVEPAGPESSQLIVSSLPLRVESPSGGEEPVEPELEPTASGYEPEAVGTELRIPSELADGIEIGERGVALGVADPDQASAPRLIEDRAAVFYSNVAADVDLVVSPTTGGFRFAAQLRSARSPERIVLPLELPGGAGLSVEGAFGAAEVEVPGPADILISPPPALDADRRSIETHLEAEGEDLVLVVEHSAGSPKFPILVDPTVQDGQIISDDLFEGTPYDPAAYGWSYFEGTPGGTHDPNLPYQGTWGQLFGAGTNSGGLFTTAPQGSTYAADLIGRWSERVPNFGSPTGTTAFYNYAKFITPWLHVAGGTTYNYPMLEYGLFRPPGPTGSNTWWARNAYYGTPNATVGPPGGETWMGPTNDQRVKQISFGLNSGPGATPPASQYRYAYLGGIRTYIADGEAPTVSGGAQTPSSAWTSSPPTNATFSFNGYDGGLGIKTLLTRAGEAAVPLAARAHSISCAGWHSGSACPQQPNALLTEVNFATDQLNEGVTKLYGKAIDVLDKDSGWAQLGSLKIDRSEPEVALSGSLIDAEGLVPTPAGTYVLEVSATDGTANEAANERSGMASIEVLVDDVRAAYETRSCPSGSCSQLLTWSLSTSDYGPGSHTITIIAKDQLGHTTVDEVVLGERIIEESKSELGMSDPLHDEAFGDDPFNSPAFDSADFIEVAGTSSGDGTTCSFSINATLLPDESAVSQQVVDYDAAGCKIMLEREATSVSSPSDYQNAALQSSASMIEGEDEIFNGHKNLNVVLSKLYVEDPANINVAEQKVRLHWRPNGNCANAGRRKGFHDSNWYEPSGWSQDLYQGTLEPNCFSVRAVVHEWFKNTAFCVPGLDTHVRFSPHVVRGYADGSAKATWKVEISGDCAGLLDFEHRFFRRV